MSWLVTTALRWIMTSSMNMPPTCMLKPLTGQYDATAAARRARQPTSTRTALQPLCQGDGGPSSSSSSVASPVGPRPFRNNDAAARASAGDRPTKGRRTPQLKATAARTATALRPGSSSSPACPEWRSCRARGALAAARSTREAGMRSGGCPATSCTSPKSPVASSSKTRTPRSQVPASFAPSPPRCFSAMASLHAAPTAPVAPRFGASAG
mmetsp:Transcript_156608/g.502771  ORF Transcript_156608/g.502771 Transcript_156608/m.502771 type:complete len:211 (+) Transcript_156608:2019-2651(+)